jgi:hypothetical protein
MTSTRGKVRAAWAQETGLHLPCHRAACLACRQLLFQLRSCGCASACTHSAPCLFLRIGTLTPAHCATTVVHGHCCCASQVVGREWIDFFRFAMATGWVPVSGRDGGGGTHHKFRRTLPHSGTVQTCVVPSSSSDFTRGIKNAAAALRRADREMIAEQQAAAAAAAQAAGAGSSRSSKAAGGHR